MPISRADGTGSNPGLKPVASPNAGTNKNGGETMKAKEIRINAALERLHKLVKPGDTVYTILRAVSKSGMTRKVDAIVIIDGVPVNLNGCIETICDGIFGYDKNGNLVVSGCGMDAGFEIVYNLGEILYPGGFFCEGRERCRSNDHSNGDRDYSRHLHKAGGYAFKHEWI